MDIFLQKWQKASACSKAADTFTQHQTVGKDTGKDTWCEGQGSQQMGHCSVEEKVRY